MAKIRPTGSRGSTAPISGHRLFPAVIALWGAALLGLICALVPASAIESLVAATGLAELIPAAGQPLTVELHLALAAVSAAIGGWLGHTLARRVTVAQYNSLPTSSNRMARITRQANVAGAGGLADTEAADPATGETAYFGSALSDDADRLTRDRFDLSAQPLTIWGDAPPSTSAGTYGPEQPELLLSEDLEAGEELQWQGKASAPEAEQDAFFEAYVDWPNEPAGDFEAVQAEPREAWPDASPDYDDGQKAEPDLFGASASPEDEIVEASVAPDIPEAQTDWEGFAAPAEPDYPADESGIHSPPGSATDLPSIEIEEDDPVLPADDEEIGQYAREAVWPSTPPAFSADLDSFGEPEEDDVWPEADAAQQARGWQDAGPFDLDDEEAEEEDEEPTPLFDTTLGAFRDYARDYSGGDDGEEEEEEEEEDEANSSFGSLLGMTVRRRAADEPIELVGFDGEPVALSDFEMESPDELEGEVEYDSPLLVRRRMGGA